MAAEPIRSLLPGWPRLMNEPMAADYLSIGVTTLRERGPAPKRHGRRRLYDRLDLDRWADRLDGQPLSAHEQQEEAAEVERRWRERRRA